MMPEPVARTTKNKIISSAPDLKRLSYVFGKYPDIQAVYLFGSPASGSTYAESDLDLAIVPRSNARQLNKLDILTELTRSGLRNIDLVILDTDDIVLKHESVRQNHLIYQTDDFDRGAYYSRVTREYLDFLPFLKVQRQAYKMRILHGQT